MSNEPTYHYLKAGEIIQPGDEYHINRFKWVRSQTAGATVKSADVGYYRRRIIGPATKSISELQMRALVFLGEHPLAAVSIEHILATVPDQPPEFQSAFLSALAKLVHVGSTTTTVPAVCRMVVASNVHKLEAFVAAVDATEQTTQQPAN